MAEVSERLGSGPSHTLPWVDLVGPVLSQSECLEPLHYYRAEHEPRGRPTTPSSISATVRMRGVGGRGARRGRPGAGPRPGAARREGAADRVGVRLCRLGRRRGDGLPVRWG